ncbi:unnamed protein product, partial [marine sediment metagenome]
SHVKLVGGSGVSPEIHTGRTPVRPITPWLTEH